VRDLKGSGATGVSARLPQPSQLNDSSIAFMSH